ncbi:hypothetical protein MPER_13271 [Moniliophthora perniciosa FA553]|nr:hypothetical protein MPER_13271 [Moniliophthora perniciosa FA553]
MKLISRSIGVILPFLILSSYANDPVKNPKGPGKEVPKSEVRPCRVTDPVPDSCCASVKLNIPNYEFANPLSIEVPSGYPDYWPTTVKQGPKDSKVSDSKFNIVMGRSCGECSRWKVELVEWKYDAPELKMKDNGEGWFEVKNGWYTATAENCKSNEEGKKGKKVKKVRKKEEKHDEKKDHD